MKRYYSAQRPIAPGSYPKQEGCKICNFNQRRYVGEIGAFAWGYIDYKHELSALECKNYELVPAGVKTWWAVITSVHEDGGVTADIAYSLHRIERPESIYKPLLRGYLYIDWFDTRQAAEDFMNEVVVHKEENAYEE